MAPSSQETVPHRLRPLFEDVVSCTDAFCLEHLTEEYAQLCRRLAAALCRKRPSPLTQGKIETWACAIVYAIGSVNFLFDKSQTPHMSAGELCERFGVSKSTASAKARKILNALNIVPFDPRRHNTAATSMLPNGAIVSERLGHSDVALTLRIYGHLTARMHREAAERLDDLHRRGDRGVRAPCPAVKPGNPSGCDSGVALISFMC